eukprot:gene11891-2446_t
MADSNGSGRGYSYQRSVKDPFSESFEGFSRGEYNAKADGRKVYMNLASFVSPEWVDIAKSICDRSCVMIEAASGFEQYTVVTGWQIIHWEIIYERQELLCGIMASLGLVHPSDSVHIGYGSYLCNNYPAVMMSKSQPSKGMP